MSVEPSFLPVVIEAAISGFSVLGGVMATVSGLSAAYAYLSRWAPQALDDIINRGIALGFMIGTLPATGAFIMALALR